MLISRRTKAIVFPELAQRPSPNDLSLGVRLTDWDVRATLSDALRRHYRRSNTLILHEMAVQGGTARMDVAVLNGHFEGYEIKSDFDSLRRLPRQIERYSLVFDRLSIVTTDRHLEALDHVLPAWCGLLVASLNRRKVLLHSARPPAQNPDVDICEVLRLLRFEEAKSVAVQFGVSCEGRFGGEGLAERLAASAHSDALRAAVLGLLRGRNWSTRQRQGC